MKLNNNYKVDFDGDNECDKRYNNQQCKYKVNNK